MNPPGVNPLIYPIVIFAGSLVIALILLTYAVSSVAAAVRKRRAQAIKDWKARGVQFVLGPTQANFLNEPRSFGVGGNGTLVLSDTAIHFAQVAPEREIVIPLRDVERAFLLRRFNGRRAAKPFLIIRRRIGDLTGFQLDAPERWAEAINRAVGAVADVTEGAQVAGYELQTS
ncbi:MAG: hypothetical protein NZM18_11800 [Thermoflexales bacterium]|nr:hypothetical protein [Thermoflexales bacterium]MDW8352773.1 hypothetical protein [Anaerolineae bacterium]